ncbi:MAG: hypothetical protein ACXVHS_05760 [Methanobacterium sp.]
MKDILGIKEIFDLNAGNCPEFNDDNDCEWRDQCDEKHCIKGTLFLSGIPAVAG